jgi:hypothetical protein
MKIFVPARLVFCEVRHRRGIRQSVRSAMLPAEILVHSSIGCDVRATQQCPAESIRTCLLQERPFVQFFERLL